MKIAVMDWYGKKPLTVHVNGLAVTLPGLPLMGRRRKRWGGASMPGFLGEAKT